MHFRIFYPAGGLTAAFHRRRFAPSRPSARARPLKARKTSRYLPLNMQRYHVDNIHFRDAKGRGQPCSTGILRFPRLGNSAKSHFALVHLSQVPFSSHACRNLEDELQRANRINFGLAWCVFVFIFISSSQLQILYDIAFMVYSNLQSKLWILNKKETFNL